MTTTVPGILAIVLFVLQRVFLAAAFVMAVICLLDWMVRTRRISPFSAIARFMRRVVDPMFAPIERRVVRSGGTPGSVPLWALVGVVVVGILLLSLVQFVALQVIALGMAVQAGPRGTLQFVLGALVGILQLAILVRVIASWIPSLSPFSPWVRWAFVISEPILAPLRRLIPPIGMMDVTPIAAYFLVRIVGGWLVSAIA